MTNKSEKLLAEITMRPMVTSFLCGMTPHAINLACLHWANSLGFCGDEARREAVQLAGRFNRQLKMFEEGKKEAEGAVMG